MPIAQFIRGAEYSVGLHLPGLDDNPDLLDYLEGLASRAGLPTGRTEKGDRLPDLWEHSIPQRLGKVWGDDLPYIVIVDNNSAAGITTAGTLSADGRLDTVSGQNPLGVRAIDLPDWIISDIREFHEQVAPDVAEVPGFWLLAVFHNLTAAEEHRILGE